MRTIWAIACIVAAVLQAVLPSVFLYLSQEEPYDVFLVVTHHKTGTALAGCVFGSMVEVLDAIGDTRFLYAYENRVVDTSTIFFKYLQSQQVALGRPSLIFSTGSPLPRKCVDGNHIDIASVRAALHNASVSPTVPTCGISMCPCHGAAGSCITASTHCFTMLPPLRFRGAHFIRHPLDIIVSAYKYHIQGKEEWLGRTLVGQTLSDMRAAGIPDKYLKNLERYTSLSVHTALNQLSTDEGIVYEGLRSLADLYSMAQEHLQWQTVDWMMTVRFEDMKKSFSKTVLQILKHGRFSHTWQGQHLASSVISRCDVWSWDNTKLRLVDHTTFNHQPADDDQLAMTLLRHPFLRKHICKLCKQLGYEELPHCGKASSDVSQTPALEHRRQSKLRPREPASERAAHNIKVHTRSSSRTKNS